ncbi:hypothetical protein HOC01_01165 [archaeon]|jgi:hypothetical protein|nr:hypothetical protein [archaeon]MBT6698070.1 hypothetical protein [archaeon]
MVIKKIKSLFNKKAQLGMIEFKFFMYGMVLGLIVALVLVLLGSKGIIPFEIPLVCG